MSLIAGRPWWGDAKVAPFDEQAMVMKGCLNTRPDGPNDYSRYNTGACIELLDSSGSTLSHVDIGVATVIFEEGEVWAR